MIHRSLSKISVTNCSGWVLYDILASSQFMATSRNLFDIVKSKLLVIKSKVLSKFSNSILDGLDKGRGFAFF